MRRTLIQELLLNELFVNHAFESYLRDTGKLGKYARLLVTKISDY